jgi:hypothetical protein
MQENIPSSLETEAIRILVEMAEEVRSHANGLDTLELFLQWSDHLTPEQFRKALRYLLRSHLVVLLPGDTLIWASPRAKRSAVPAEPEPEGFTWPDDTRVLDGMEPI